MRPMPRPVAKATPQKTTAEKRIEVSLKRPEARSAAVAGSFNNWDPATTPMQRAGDGTWKAAISLRPGRYEYRFVVDGQWMADPNAKESVGNPYGSTNSVLVV